MTFISDVNQWAERCVNDPYWLACCLQRLGRFGGQHPLSNVLIHSLEVHDMLLGHDPQVRLWALYHDAHEVLSGEITRPYKTGRTAWMQQEADEVLKEKFGITCDVSAVAEADTKHGDYEAAQWEKTIYKSRWCPVVEFEDLVRELRQ